MERKLKCAIIDDELKSHQTIIEMLKNSPIGEITHSFYKPSEFLEQIHTISIDVVFLDIIFYNDTLQGFDLAPILKAENKIIIFISGSHERIIEACNHAGALDVIPKPNSKEKLVSALMKAWKITSYTSESSKKEHELFYVAESREQISLLLSDILYVKTATADSRNKEIVLKSGELFTLMDYTFEYLLKRAPKLVQINISELISYDIVAGVFHDTITVKSYIPKDIPRTLTLSKRHRKEFKIHFE